MDKPNYGDGEIGRTFEDKVELYLNDSEIEYEREFKIMGKGKRWRVDFFLPNSNCVILCKKTNPKATLIKSFFLADICRLIDMRLGNEDINEILLFDNYTTSLNNVIFCSAHKIYLLYSLNGLFILSDENFGSASHVNNINEMYIELRKDDKPTTFIPYLRRKKILHLISKYPQTKKTLSEQLNVSEYIIKRATLYLEQKDLIFTKRYGSQGGPLHFFLRRHKKVIDYLITEEDT